MKTLLKIHTICRLIALPLLLLALTPTPAFAQDDDTIAEQRVALNWQVQPDTHSPQNSDSLLDILQFLSSGILVLVGFWIQSLFTEKRRQKERADDAKRNKLVKLENLFRTVGQFDSHLTKLRFFLSDEDNAQEIEQRVANVLVEIRTITDAYFNELSDHVEKLCRYHIGYKAFTKHLSKAKRDDRKERVAKLTDQQKGAAENLAEYIKIVREECRKIANELQKN